MINVPRRVQVDHPAERRLGGAGEPVGHIREKPRKPLLPLPVSLVFHALVIAFLILAIHRSRLLAPPAQPGIAVVFQSTGLTKSGKENAAPKAQIHGAPAMAANSGPIPSLPPPAAVAPPEVRLSAPRQSRPVTQPNHIPAPQPHSHSSPPKSVEHRRVPSPRYLVMNGMSFGSGAHAPAPPTRINGRLDLQLSQSDLLHRAPAITFKGKAGPDWESEFTRWVNEHKYYPEGAAENGEQGKVTIAMTVLPDGSVRNLRLISSSGAPLLDMAWLGLFRGVRVPPFPPDTNAKRERIVATMHYILVH